jgi:hypothetical protein
MTGAFIKIELFKKLLVYPIYSEEKVKIVK